MASVTIAAAQTVVSRDIAENGRIIRAMIEEAASRGARLAVFCEGALSGYAKAQFSAPEDWRDFDWATQERALRAIAETCGRLGIFAAVGGAHRLGKDAPPHNSLYVFSDWGSLLTRYDKRFLSHSELGGWYTPGREGVVIEIDGYRFGCAICIESQFPEVFGDYEREGVDGVLFSSYGIPDYFQIALRAHAGLNCLWIAAATPAQKAHKGSAGIIGPDGGWAAQGPEQSGENALVTALLDRDDPAYDIPLNKARPWRRRARQGDIYREKMVEDPRSHDRRDL